MDSGEMPPQLPASQSLPFLSSPSSSFSFSSAADFASTSLATSSSSASSAALIKTICPPMAESFGFVTPCSSFTPVEPKVEHLAGVSDIPVKFSPPIGDKPPSLLSYSSEFGGIPRPLESLQSPPIPPFLSKTYDIVDDPSLDHVVSWGPAGQSFVVWDQVEFSRAVLPRNFKHNNFSSFVRQLNTYVDKWEFSNEAFLRGKKSLMKIINRRRSSQAQQIDPCLSSEMGKFGTESELQKLRQEKDMLMQEVLELKQEHLVTVKKMDALNGRLKLAEGRQKQMITFLAKVVQNPAFLTQLKEMKVKREIASPRPVRKFLKQKQLPFEILENKSTVQPIVKYSMGSSSNRKIPRHLLQDMAHKLDLDSRKQEEFDSSGKPPEGIPGPLFNPNDNFEGTKPMSTEADVSFSCSKFLISSPAEVITENMVSDHLPPVSESFGRKDLTIDTSKGKNALEIQVPSACFSEHFESSADDISQEQMLLDSATPASERAFEEEMWSLGLGDGGIPFTSGLDIWDNIDYINPEELAVETGPSAMWDLGFKSPDEGLDIGKLFESEIPLQQNIVEEGHLKVSET